MPRHTTLPHIFRLLAATAFALSCGTAAFAQTTTVEELTVTGHPTSYPETFSYRVSYADLDLKQEADRKELDRRIAVTAAFVCKKVDQPDSACRAEAVNQANKQEQKAIHLARAHGEHPHGPAWVPPPGG
jgi:UrcA family protein